MTRTLPLAVLPALLLLACGGGHEQLADDSLASTTAALGYPPVELLYLKAASRFAYPGAEGQGRMFGYVAVANLAYQKDVAARWGHGGAWNDQPAHYLGSLGGGREVWAFETPEVSYSPRLSAEFQLALRYRVGGREYWDNHGGANWKIATGPRTVFPADLVLGSTACALRKANAWASAGQASLQGLLLVKNLAYRKRLRVVYSTDGWQTVQTGEATYGRPVSDGAEEWYFEVPLETGAAAVSFALSCEMNGATTWDNNFGRDYSMGVPGFIE